MIDPSEASKTDFYEAIWEKSHPEDAKKIKEEAE